MLHIKTKESVIKRGGACFKFFAETKSLKQKQTFKKKKNNQEARQNRLVQLRQKEVLQGIPNTAKRDVRSLINLS